ncbi:MAG TPA: GNAT family N-acetyltransferase [Gammaproteobacteria bacterium]
MKAPATLRTARLLLRRPVAADADAVFARFASDADVTRYLSWRRHITLEDTRAFIAMSEAQWDSSPAGPYLIERAEDGLLLGSTGLACDGPSRAETGYVLARDAWGQGFATEALQAMVELAPTVGVRRLYALCHTEHAASARVLEKCGFVRERVLPRHVEFPNLAPGELADVFCYVRRVGPLWRRLRSALFFSSP